MYQKRIGNRVPEKYFVASGIGESDITDHAGSFDAALVDAGIQNFNHICYSSLMPPQARRVDKPENYEFGSVAEGIMAFSTVRKGQRATAGLIRGWVYKGEEKIGGLVAEHNKNYEKKLAENNLRDSINEMFQIRYGDKEGYKLKDVEILGLKSFTPKREYGTALVAIVFTEYEYPVLSE